MLDFRAYSLGALSFMCVCLPFTCSRGPVHTLLSKGFGFLEMKDEEEAKQLVSKLDGSILDEHRLQLAISTSNKKQNQASTEDGR